MCGSEIENVDYEEVKEISAYDALRDYEFYKDDELYPMDYNRNNLLLPNSNPPKNIEIQDSGDCVVDLTNIKDTADLQISWMCDRYEKYITHLKSVFGENNVKIKFGLIQYWN